MKRAHRKLSVVIPAAAMLVLALLTFVGPALATIAINGAGATFPMPLYYQWENSYYSYTHQSVRVNYQGIGSGGGVAAIENGVVSVSVIPHTYRNTTLAGYRPGARVNVECDVLAKHVEKLLRKQDARKALTVEDLRESGY